MNMKKLTITSKLMSGAFALMTIMSMSSCSGLVDAVFGIEDNPSGGTTKPTTVPGIPSDASATANPTLPAEANTVIPNISYSVSSVSGATVVRFDMTGIQDPADPTKWVTLSGTGESDENIWVSIDGKAKGFKIVNTSETGSTSSKVDLVFLVDNSGSMGQEADAIANQIDAWATKLAGTMDIRFGIVGFGYNVGSEYEYLINDYGVAGALNLTTADKVTAYLNRGDGYGVGRTLGYEGADADELRTIAQKDLYSKAGGECGIQALRFADENFSFRSGANRVYVMFTDDCNYPGGNPDISIDYVKDPLKWPTSKGTIHSVISESKDELIRRTQEYVLNSELPWLPSDFTGGTIKYAKWDFSDVTLEDLPVTGALQNSYYIDITNVDSLFDGKAHVVKVTVLSPNGTIRAEREFTMIFTK